ncbi:MAG TPA: DUF2520 domain-containing protein, partial [Terriglobales bacterium]|nr:DUF2520 domain-containing protein [Terriglobales bacterium]
MRRKPTITIIGPGKLGTALTLSLRKAGYTIDEIVTGRQSSSRTRAALLARNVQSQCRTIAHATLSADVVWLCVPDGEIRRCARDLRPRTDWQGKTVLHSSGALASDELDALRREGATVASLHPLMTFVSASVPSLDGVPFAVEGDAKAVGVAMTIARDLGGSVFPISKKHKPAYHAWGSFSSPLLVAVLVTAEEVARSAGISSRAARPRMLPILQQTLSNYAKYGAAEAFSGPLIRGDVATI